MEINFDDFKKLDIRIGKVLAAEKVEGADKLLKLSVDLGEAAPRTIVSGIAQFYTVEELIGKSVPILANLAPRILRGIESKGMALMAIDETLISSSDPLVPPVAGHKPVLLFPIKEVPPGSPVG